MRRSVEDRFWPKVDVRDFNGCWLWTGARDGWGYGQFRTGRMVPAHRWAYTELVGPIPAGMQLDHTCHVRACVNPDHLRVVTQAQNQQNRKGAHRNSRSGVRGVFWDSRKRRWVATITLNGKLHSFRHTHRVLAEQAAVRLRLRLFTHSDGR